eukprot:UN12177
MTVHFLSRMIRWTVSVKKIFGMNAITILNTHAIVCMEEAVCYLPRTVFISVSVQADTKELVVK